MFKTSGQWSVVSGQWSVAARRRCGSLLLVACSALLMTACREDMQNQPKMKPYRPGAFFQGDKLSFRPFVEGTVARGHLNEDLSYYTGKKAGAPAPSANDPYSDVVSEFPFPVTAEVVAHGRERFNINCSMCHGLTGQGNGMIVRRGFKKPTNYHTDQMRNAPVGHFFDVITNGFGAMPAYATQVPVYDRWAIAAYIRVLQKSQAEVADNSNTGANANTARGMTNANTAQGNLTLTRERSIATPTPIAARQRRHQEREEINKWRRMISI